MASKDTDPLDELVRLQVMQLRRSWDTQSEGIVELSRAGFSNGRIADLLGTSEGTVKVTLQRSKKSKAASGKTSDTDESPE